jgi:hypothetical protein
MKRRVNFNAWALGDLICPAYAMHDEDNFGGRGATVAAAIARKNGLHVVTLRPDDQSGNETIYQSTLGRPCPGGGWTPVKQVWFSIARETK